MASEPRAARQAKSICHRWPPRLKLLLTAGVILAGLCVPAENWPLLGVLIVLVFVGQSLARIPLSLIAGRLAVFLPAVLMLSFSFPLAAGFREGWDLMVLVFLRSTLAFLSVLWLVNVLPFDQLLVKLRRSWVPDILIAMLAFMHRYLFLLWGELERMRGARRARNFAAGGVWLRWKTSAQMIGMLLIRGMSRGERVHGAMLARGWDGRVRTLDSSE